MVTAFQSSSIGRHPMCRLSEGLARGTLCLTVLRAPRTLCKPCAGEAHLVRRWRTADLGVRDILGPILHYNLIHLHEISHTPRSLRYQSEQRSFRRSDAYGLDP